MSEEKVWLYWDKEIYDEDYNSEGTDKFLPADAKWRQQINIPNNIWIDYCLSGMDNTSQAGLYLINAYAEYLSEQERIRKEEYDVWYSGLSDEQKADFEKSQNLGNYIDAYLKHLYVPMISEQLEGSDTLFQLLNRSGQSGTEQKMEQPKINYFTGKEYV